MTPYERDALRRLREPAIRCLDRIPIRECGEPLVPLKGISPRVRLKAPVPWLRKRVAEMVAEAASSLPKGLFLVVTTGLRSVKMQERAYRRYSRMLRRQHPAWPLSVLRREANRFLHPMDSVSPPGHCTGGSVDVGLAYGNGRMLDMISSERPQEKTWPTFCPHLTAEARNNRALLYSVMIEAGFSNCYEEWWHYSFG
ncbi:MAG: hypothetical protein GTO55_02125, partial [Armatimonadetes bacterium]|nr:hypothetical protein [Armatimonadota bacterium]NIM23076.1 hypothetical protein [Armatimonadota bacterium]NIM66944.1 hypothetical protein [Armatimonadota bacterium]NIM75478.1 hypothetical protein [Armatimonadota bacterium]NIN05135.1 hypothetical protein [Armatimonadota bacterium]